MRYEEKQSLIAQYLQAYNSLDVEGLMEVIHPEVVFKNVSGGRITAEASGAEGFRDLAEKSKELFRERRQTLRAIEVRGRSVSIQVDFKGLLAQDLEPGMKAGETLQLQGTTDFRFQDGRIKAITDIS